MIFAKNTLGLKVLTDNGYQSFAGVAYMGDKLIYRVEFGNKSYLECTYDHKIYDHKFNKKEVQDLKIGDWVVCKAGNRTKVKKIINTGDVLPVYDLIEVNGHRYFTNEVLSSNCEFFSDEETLISATALNKITKMTEEPTYYIGTSRWYADIKANKTYMVTLDPSEGVQKDFAAIQVFQYPEMVQVAEWSHNRALPKEQVKMLLVILTHIHNELSENPEQLGEPEIFWTFESNARAGGAIGQVIEHTGEERFPGFLVSDPKKGKVKRLGLGTTRSKSQECVRLKSLIETNRLRIKSKGLVKELKSFVAVDNTYKAKVGDNDDLVMSTILVVKLLDSIVRWEDRSHLKEYIDDEELSDLDSDTAPMPFIV